MLRKIRIPNFKSISDRTTEKSLENLVGGHGVDGQTDGRTEGQTD